MILSFVKLFVKLEYCNCEILQRFDKKIYDILNTRDRLYSITECKSATVGNARENGGPASVKCWKIVM